MTEPTQLALSFTDPKPPVQQKPKPPEVDTPKIDIQTWSRQQIADYLYKTCLAGCVPSNFEVVDADWIDFDPTHAFWKAWHSNKSYMQHHGVCVYPLYERYQLRLDKKKRQRYTVRVTMSLLDHPDR